MKIDYLRSLTAVERLDYFVVYMSNRDRYPPDEREKLDHYFEDF